MVKVVSRPVLPISRPCTLGSAMSVNFPEFCMLAQHAHVVAVAALALQGAFHVFMKAQCRQERLSITRHAQGQVAQARKEVRRASLPAPGELDHVHVGLGGRQLRLA